MVAIAERDNRRALWHSGMRCHDLRNLMKIGGLLLCFGGMILLCGMDATAKALGGVRLGAFEIGFVRYAGSTIWLALYIALTRGPWPDLRNWRRHVLRGVLSVTTASLFFYGVTHLPLAIATALAMSAPVYVSILGIVFLRERPAPTLGLAIALGIAGSAVVVLGGDFSGTATGDISGWIAGLLAPLSYAATIVVLKHHADDESAPALTLSTSAVAALVLLPLAAPGFVVPPPSAWPLLPLAGLLGACGFILLTTGLRTTPASTYAIVDYASLLFAALFGFLFFTEVPQVSFWIGGAMIVGACVVAMRTASVRAATPAVDVGAVEDQR
jgi:S-adenosylmethionine uptake transporter